MLDFADVDGGHRFEAAMRMLSYAAGMVGGLELGRAGIVQQQERAGVLALVVIGKHRAHRKAVAHPVGTGAGVQTEDLLHGRISCCAAPAGPFVMTMKIRAQRPWR
ncbi:hypothetical protein D9M70_576850 [compost metagenome]